MEGVRTTKVLMHGGSGINILYKDAFERLNIDASKLRLFHGIVPGCRVMHLGTIVLSFTYADQVHYR
jgi:hypothetical protein